jgi:hypothetical protein
MENNELMEPLAGEPAITLTREAETYLQEAGRWASFLGIIGFVFCGIIAICSFFAGAILSAGTAGASNPLAAIAGMGGIVLTIVYLLIALFYFFFSLYLYQFGDRIKRGIKFTDNLHVTNAFSKLKSFFKLWGITTIVVLGLYALIIIGAIVFAATFASHH